MLKLRALILLGLCVAVPAQAGLFSDDDARKQIQAVEVRVLKLEESDKRLTQSVFDLQGQIDALNTELRKLRGQNEEVTHGLQEAEKREKDFYVDLDTRLRHFESPAAAQPVDAATVAATPNDDNPATENRAIEMAYSLLKAGKFADAALAFDAFLQRYPNSVHVENASYWLGNTQFELKDYKTALETYRGLLKARPGTPRAADALFGIAACQQELKAVTSAKATLKQLVAKYPDSSAAAKAKQLLAVSK